MICMIICNGCGYKSLVDAENDVGVGPLLDLSRCRICGAGGGMLDFIGWLEDLLPAGFEAVTGRVAGLEGSVDAYGGAIEDYREAGDTGEAGEVREEEADGQG